MNVYEEFENELRKHNREKLERARDIHSWKLPELQNDHRVLEIAVDAMQKLYESENHPDMITIRGIKIEKYIEIDVIEKHIQKIDEVLKSLDDG